MTIPSTTKRKKFVAPWSGGEGPKPHSALSVERDVIVDVSRAFPGAGHVTQDELPLWVKTSALRLEPSMRARQVAWIHRASGGVRAYTDVFQPVRPDARPAFGRVGSVGLARWPHIGIGPMR
jgi:hypothetical protein